MKIDKFNEAVIKAKLLSELRKQGIISKKSVIANEYRLGALSLRADLAILSSEFIGIEIKSELDSLKRLERQVQGYLEYFDRVIIVLASKHIKKIKCHSFAKAEIWEIGQAGDFTVWAKDLNNRAASQRPITELMTANERSRFCRSLAGKAPLAADATQTILQYRESFKLAFHNKFGQTSERFWKSVGRRAVKVSDLLLLSRYHDQRQQRVMWSQRQADIWQNWQRQAEAHFSN